MIIQYNVYVAITWCIMWCSNSNVIHNYEIITGRHVMPAETLSIYNLREATVAVQLYSNLIM